MGGCCRRSSVSWSSLVRDVRQTGPGEEVLLPLGLESKPLPGLNSPVGEAGSVDGGERQQTEVERSSPATLNSSSV